MVALHRGRNVPLSRPGVHGRGRDGSRSQVTRTRCGAQGLGAQRHLVPLLRARSARRGRLRWVERNRAIVDANAYGRGRDDASDPGLDPDLVACRGVQPHTRTLGGRRYALGVRRRGSERGRRSGVRHRVSIRSRSESRTRPPYQAPAPRSGEAVAGRRPRARVAGISAHSRSRTEAGSPSSGSLARPRRPASEQQAASSF